MELASVRDLKTSLGVDLGVQSGFFSKRFTDLSMRGDTAYCQGVAGRGTAYTARMGSVPVRAATQPVGFPALGATRLPTRGWGLAIRIQEPNHDQALIEYLVEQAGGEADVRRVGRIAAQSTLPVMSARCRPLARGYSIGPTGGETGTLGCFVKRPGHGLEVISANHVVADANRGTLGDAILQPGQVDGGEPGRDAIGHLSEIVRLEESQVNTVDVALCELSSDTQVGPSLGGWIRDVAPDMTAFADSEVTKLGRTTGKTKGTVLTVELDGVLIDEPHLGPILFNGLVEIEGAGAPFSLPGDSGAVVTDVTSRTALAIVVGGNAVERLTYGSPLVVALATLNAQLFTG